MPNTPLNPDAVTAVARALNEAGWTCYEGGMEPGEYDGCEDCQEVCNELARKALAAYLAVAQPVVNSVEELDALPLMTILCDFHGYRAEKWAHGFKLVGSVGVYSITLPARVLYRPTEELTNGR